LERLKTLLDSDELPAIVRERPALVRFGRLVGASQAMAALYEQIERAARTWDPILICGDSGTGKELVARELHARGVNSSEPFFSENCAAVAEGLLESELFGHRKGAFTGASADRKGMFELAGRGTLFLDEVGDMSPSMQGKLLRVLQEGVVRPVGGDKHVPVHCRVLAATHHDLRQLVNDNRFREDLYYRLDVLRINVPPLRKRPEDVLLLFDLFVREAGHDPLEFSPRARQLLTRYAWPGNVRELQNEARRLLTVTARQISSAHLSLEICEGRGVSQSSADTGGRTLGEVEAEMVAAALRECDGNKSQAARKLGIPRSTLYRLIERHELP
jgi:transcriptional regulator with PAS, ATPase and Fis domain